MTWWLGSESALTGSALGVAATVTIVIAFIKVLLIGREFMELRSAPLVLRAAFDIWVVVFATAAVVLVVV